MFTKELCFKRLPFSTIFNLPPPHPLQQFHNRPVATTSTTKSNTTTTNNNKMTSMAPMTSQRRGVRICYQCGTCNTAQWRYGANGSYLLCNACGIRDRRRRNCGGDRRRRTPGPRTAGVRKPRGLTLAPLRADTPTWTPLNLSPILPGTLQPTPGTRRTSIRSLLNDDVPTLPTTYFTPRADVVLHALY